MNRHARRRKEITDPWLCRMLAERPPKLVAVALTRWRASSGIGRTPKWVRAILEERGIEMAAFKSIPMYRIHASG